MAKKKEPPDVVETLRERLRESGLSLNQLSDRSGVNKGQISRFLRGERDVTAATFALLCRALGLKLVPEEEE